jgi:transposase
MWCYDCDTLSEIDPDFADPLRTYTKALENYVVAVCRLTTIKDTARITGLSWHIVKDIDKRYLTKKYSKIPIKGVRHLAIDEFAVRKGHRYMTTIVDLDTERILYVGKGKDSNAIIPFLKRLKRSRTCSVEVIAMDMSPAYISAVQEILPHIPIVFDHFHVIKLMNEHLDDLRRRIFHTADDSEKKLLKGVRYLILMGAKRLSQQEPENRDRLAKALAINTPLTTGYYLKEKLTALWSLDTQEEAIQFLQEWYQEAESSKLPELQKMAHTLQNHEQGILAYFLYRISTGPLEGINNKIKTLKREAYGFKDAEYFKLKLLGLHETQYALLG